MGTFNQTQILLITYNTNYLTRNTMLFNKLIVVAFYGINWLCWTFGKYLLINVKERNQEDFSGIEDNKACQWIGLKNNTVITLSPPPVRIQSRCDVGGCTNSFCPFQSTP